MIIWFIELTLCSYLNFLNIAQQVPIKISKVIKAVPAKGILFAISKPAEAALTKTFEAKCAILSIYVYYLVFVKERIGADVYVPIIVKKQAYCPTYCCSLGNKIYFAVRS